MCVCKKMLRRLGAACLGHGMATNQHESKTATSSVDFIGTIFCPACKTVKYFRIIRELELNVNIIFSCALYERWLWIEHAHTGTLEGNGSMDAGSNLGSAAKGWL